MRMRADICLPLTVSVVCTLHREIALLKVSSWGYQDGYMVPAHSHLMFAQRSRLPGMVLLQQHAFPHTNPKNSERRGWFQADWQRVGLVIKFSEYINSSSFLLLVLTWGSPALCLWSLFHLLSYWHMFYRDNFIILQAIIASVAFYIFPSLADLPIWNTRGVIAALLLHIGISEPLYYWGHRCFHGDYLFTRYHSLHHSSIITQSFTGERNPHLISSLFPQFLVFSCLIFFSLRDFCLLQPGVQRFWSILY